MAGEGKERTSKNSVAKVAAALVALLLLGVMASGALADGDPFSAITAITGTSTSSNDTSSTSSDTTGTPTDATTSDSTSTDATTSSDAATTTSETTTSETTTADSTTTSTSPLTPSISSDLVDYAPGSTVTLSGSGWGAGESVHLSVNDTIGQTWQYSADVVADLSGAFSASFQLPNTFISNYDVTATGAAGDRATTTFTDGNATSVTGTITDSVTHAAISGATVGCTSGCTNSPSATDTTDATGKYVFDASPGNGPKLTFSGNGPATLTLTVTETGYSNGTITLAGVNNGDSLTGKDAALSPSGPAKLAFTTATMTGTVGQCLGPISVQTQNEGGTATNVSATTIVNLTTDNGSTGAGGFYSDNACSSSVTTRSIASGSSSTSFFYKATGRGTGTHALTASATGLTSASQNETINKASQTITFNAPTDKTFGGADFDPGATASSGLAVTYTGTTPSVCTIVSNKVHIVAAGSCSVSAAQAGDSNYNAATSVSQTFTIAKKPVTITPDSGQSKVFGASDPILPFTNDGGLAAGAFTGALSRAAGENVGSYAINLGNLSAGTDYTLSLSGTTVDFSITAKPVTITPDGGQSKVFGTPDPSLTFTNNGGLVAGAFTGALGRAAGENAGTYAITLGNLSAGTNYTLSLSATTVNFAITRATGSVSINNIPSSATYGGSFTAMYTVLGDGTPSGVSETPDVCSVSGDLVSYVAAGLCKLHATATQGTNYLAATGSTQSFTIDKKPVSVTPDSGQSKVYGSSDPTLTYTSVGLIGGDSLSGQLDRAPGQDVGSYAITLGTLTAGSNYTVALSGTTVQFAVTPHDLDVSADPQSKVYGADDPVLTYSVTLTDLQYSDTAAGVLSGSLTRDAGESVAGGPYAIKKGSLAANNNYALVFSGSSLTVTPHDLDVSADPQSKVYGAADPTLSYAVTAADLQYSDTAAGVLSGSLARAAGQSVAGGPYAINKGTLAANSNYTLVFAGANLTITKAPLTVTANDKSMLLNGTVPALTATLTGFQYSETLASSGVTGAATCTSSNGKTVGPFDIVCTIGTLQAANYSFGPFVKGKLTVTYALAGTTCNSEAGHQILQPINADGTSVSKQGSTVPAKFRVCDVNGVSIGSAGTVTSFKLVQTVSGTIVNTVDEAVDSTTPDTAFRWDSSAQQWIYNISTKPLKANYTYYYDIALADGTHIPFHFGLK
jgi:hypothetical protein